MQVSAKHKRFLLGMYYFANDGSQNYLVFKPGWFPTGLSSEEIKSPDVSLAAEVIWFNVSRLVLIQEIIYERKKPTSIYKNSKYISRLWIRKLAI